MKRWTAGLTAALLAAALLLGGCTEAPAGSSRVESKKTESTSSAGTETSESAIGVYKGKTVTMKYRLKTNIDIDLCQYWFLTGISSSPFFPCRHQLLIPKFLCPQRKYSLFFLIPPYQNRRGLLCILPIAVRRLRGRRSTRLSIVSSCLSPFHILIFYECDCSIYQNLPLFNICYNTEMIFSPYSMRVFFSCEWFTNRAKISL